MSALRRACVLLMLLVAVTACRTGAAASPLVGTWRVLSIENRDSASAPWRQPFGAAPFGYAIYTGDGRHAMNFTRTPVPPMFASGADRTGTDGEVRTTFESYFSWFGRYRVDAARGIITHQIEGSLWPSWRNTTQVRPFVIRGDTLVLGDSATSRRVLVRAR